MTPRDAERILGLGLLSYEFAALATGRVPTLTELIRARRKWLVPVATALLALHMWLAPPREPSWR